MKGLFVVRDQGKLLEFKDFDSIPLEFDHLITFKPEEIPPPHTPEQHQIMESYHSALQELMTRER